MTERAHTHTVQKIHAFARAALCHLVLPHPASSAHTRPETVAQPSPNLRAGCWPGMEFTVDFEGRAFNITVPDGCEPGMPLTVEVPPAEDAPPPPPPPPPPEPEPPPKPKPKPSASKYLAGTDIPPFRGAGSSTASSSDEWAPASSLFAMGPSEGFGREAGEFHVGQLVQVRSAAAAAAHQLPLLAGAHSITPSTLATPPSTHTANKPSMRLRVCACHTPYTTHTPRRSHAPTATGPMAKSWTTMRAATRTQS